TDGSYHRLTAAVDTGAPRSLLPIVLLSQFEHRVIAENVVIEQAGIAKQFFLATEAIVWLFLEDAVGGRTKELEVRAWFADTEVALLGFNGILDIATLNIDMRQSRAGWIEIDD